MTETLAGSYLAEGEDAMVALGEIIGRALRPPMLVFLEGELGAGKTTLARGIHRAFCHGGAVKSPTYTLVEPYALEGFTLYHFDLYRLGDPEELEYMGIRDYFDTDNVALVEWPERGLGVLPPPDVAISIEIAGNARLLHFEATGERGVECLRQLPIEPVTPGKSKAQ